MPVVIKRIDSVYESKYSRIDQIRFVEDKFKKSGVIWSILECLDPYATDVTRMTIM